MADIDSMLGDVLTREGGYVNNPHDPGGPTNFGITQATLSAWLGRPATVDEVQAMTADTARAIYKQNYYTKPMIDHLPDVIQPCMLDAAVNSGPSHAVQWLQQVLNDNNYGPLTVDGGLGPKSIAAATTAAAAMGDGLARALIEKRRQFLQGLCAANPGEQVFLAGWMNRLDGLESQLA